LHAGAGFFGRGVGEERLKQEVQTDTERVDRRLGLALLPRKNNGIDWRMKKSMEGGSKGTR